MKSIKQFLLVLFASGAVALSQTIPGIENEDIDDVILENSRAEEVEKNLKFSAFQQSFQLPLKETESIFSEDFRFLFSTDETTGFADYPQEEEALGGSFYSVGNSTGSIYVEEDEHGLEVEGIIDDELRLIPSNEPTADGFITHKALRFAPQTYYDPPLADDYGKDYGLFIINDKEAEMVQGLNPDWHERKWVGRIQIKIPQIISDYQISDGKRQKNPGKTAYIEVLVVFDYKNSVSLKFKKKRIYKYLGVFWGSIQRRYAVFQKPEIRFVLSGVVIITDPSHEPFLNKSLLSSKQVDGKKMLTDFSKWLYKSSAKLPSFDIAFLQTGVDIVLASSSNGNLLGRAFIGAVCKKSHRMREMWNCGEGEDIAPYYTGMLTAAHEIGHILGANHDGENGLCHDDGYMMSIYAGGNNSYIFSSCSQKEISAHLRDSSATCVWNSPKPFVKLIKNIPLLSAKKMCEGLYGVGSTPYEKMTPKICEMLWCLVPNGQILGLIAPPEGTQCGKKKKCIEGKCRRY